MDLQPYRWNNIMNSPGSMVRAAPPPLPPTARLTGQSISSLGNTTGSSGSSLSAGWENSPDIYMKNGREDVLSPLPLLCAIKIKLTLRTLGCASTPP